MNKYDNWIRLNYWRIDQTLGKCHEACLRMQKVFPELRITNGLVCLLHFEDKNYEHWWLVSKSGKIIDPTAGQYVHYGTPIVSYNEIDENHPARNYESSSCMECGDRFYLDEDKSKFMPCCSQNCLNSYIKYINDV